MSWEPLVGEAIARRRRRGGEEVSVEVMVIVIVEGGGGGGGRRAGEVVLEVSLDERRGNDGMAGSAGSGVTRSPRGYQPQPRSRREGGRNAISTPPGHAGRCLFYI